MKRFVFLILNLNHPAVCRKKSVHTSKNSPFTFNPFSCYDIYIVQTRLFKSSSYFIITILALTLFTNFFFSNLAMAISQSESNKVKIKVELPALEITTIDSIFFDISSLTFGSRIKISGKAPSKSIIKVLIQGKNTVYSLLKETLADANGNWEIIIEEKLPPGTYIIFVIAIDQYQREITSPETEFEVPKVTAEAIFLPQSFTASFSKQVSQIVDSVFTAILAWSAVVVVTILYIHLRRKKNEPAQTK